MKTNLLVTVAGPDHPGITQSLMNIISKTEASIVDMGQAVTHGLLSLSFVLNLDDNASDSLTKDLLFEASKMKLNLTFEKLPEDNREWDQEGEGFVLTCVSTEKISPAFMRDMASILAEQKINISQIEKVSPDHFRSVEIKAMVPKNLDLSLVKSSLMNLTSKHPVDIAFIKDNVFRRTKRLIVFDMDSTLIQTEVIDEMAKNHGVGEEIAAITERAMNGELDYTASLKERVSKLKGLKETELQEILDRLPLTPGVEEFITTIKNLGFKVAVISGGFSFFADALKGRLGLDYAFANELDISSGELTGKVRGTIIDAEQKATLVKLIAQQEKIHLEQIVAIGDGANDLPMLNLAGLGIAFHAKDIVKKEAQNHMSHGPMTSILYFLGLTDGHQKTP